MPIFEYLCGDCHHRFEALVCHDHEAACPSCSSVGVQKQISVFAVGAKDDSAGPASSCGRCGDPRGPDACRLDN
jgi:putative FmdB family regulatory protein